MGRAGVVRGAEWFLNFLRHVCLGWECEGIVRLAVLHCHLGMLVGMETLRVVVGHRLFVLCFRLFDVLYGYQCDSVGEGDGRFVSIVNDVGRLGTGFLYG